MRGDHRTRLTQALATMLLAPLCVGACAISQQQEVALGASSAAQVSRELPLVHDALVTQYITTLGRQLAAATDTRGLTWTFTVVDTKEVNAFALPGGWIYVNRGLIERAGTMTELAGVLAHEIGHVTRRHSVRQLQQLQGANLGVGLLCTLTRSCQTSVGTEAINIGGSALFAKFSREDELEADSEAVTTTVNAGISPRGIPGMFRVLLSERQRTPDAVAAFFSTHPLEERRIREAEARITTYPAARLNQLTMDTPAFRAFRARLHAMPLRASDRTSASRPTSDPRAWHGSADHSPRW